MQMAYNYILRYVFYFQSLWSTGCEAWTIVINNATIWNASPATSAGSKFFYHLNLHLKTVREL